LLFSEKNRYPPEERLTGFPVYKVQIETPAKTFSKQRERSNKIPKSFLINEDFGRHSLHLIPIIIFLDIFYLLMANIFLQRTCRLQKIFKQTAIYDMKCYKENLLFNSKSPNFNMFNISSIRGGSDGTPRSSQSINYINIFIFKIFLKIITICIF
jgi:hypothetical protein